MVSKGSIGHLLELAKKDGFDNLSDWNEWKNAKKDGFDNLSDWNEWKRKSKILNPCSKEFQKYINKLGLTGNQYIKKLVEEGKLSDPTEVEKKYRKELAQKKGFEDNDEYKENLARERGFENNKEYQTYLCKKRGFKNWSNYHDDLAKKRGFKDNSEYVKEWGHDNKVHDPMSKNYNCSSYLGVHIGENISDQILIDIFGDIEERMPYGYPGYDRIVKGGYKVDIKTRVLNNNGSWKGWIFPIGYNNITDYFLLLAFDNREDKNLLHILLIHKDEMIRERKFWKRTGIVITNKSDNLSEFRRYEYIYKLKCLKDIQNKLKEED